MARTWTHSICDPCWERRCRERNENPAGGGTAPVERCCYCDVEHRSGIFVRDNPESLNCDWNHHEPGAHGPGPWSWDEGGPFMCELRDSQGRTVVYHDSSVRLTPENRALLEAAPMMLDALKKSVEAFGPLPQIVAAIAKAEGRT